MKKMIKRLSCFVISIVILLSLTGCWNYRGLNDLSIVSGLAIDRGSDGKDFILTFEILDASVPQDQGIKILLLEIEGKTIFDAVRNAKSRLSNKLFFGNMMIVIISEDLASHEDLSGLIDFFLRDAECRETMNVIISGESKAGDLLKAKGLDTPILSMEFQKIVQKDIETTSSTISVQIYEIYNILHGQGRSLTLPCFKCVESIKGEKILSSNGIVIYEREKMIGKLSPQDTKFFLFVLGKVAGGVLTFSSKDTTAHDVSLEIAKNKTKISYTYKNDKIKFLVSTETDVYLNEYFEPLDIQDKEKISALQNKAEENLKQNILNTVKKVQNDFGSDIFGFGNTVYKKDFKLWKQLKQSWDSQYKSMEVEVTCKINIKNTALVIKS